MKTSLLFNTKNKEVPFSFIGKNFTEWLGDLDVENNSKPLIGRKLGKPMNDCEIESEFHPLLVSMGEIYATLKTLDHSAYALFYAKSGGVLRTVRVYWYGDGWRAGANAMDGYRWLGGGQVFSRNSGSLDTLSSDSLTPSLPDTLVINGITYHKK